MADIFVSYTSSDRDWAFWIGKELEALGHTPHIHEWEIERGGDIYAWMEKRHDAADHVLCLVSDAYLQAPYSTLERNAALWQAVTKRPGFALFVVVKPCRLPTLSDHIRRCELFGVTDDEARNRFREFMATRSAPTTALFPGQAYAVSNIPIRVPEHFLGREDALQAVEAALKRYEGRVAVTALHGLRGVGKTTLAAAYAARHRAEYRVTWWIRAQSEPSMREDLISLGIRLGWVQPDEKVASALARVFERFGQEGEGLLLIYDNAIDMATLGPYLPKGGAAQVLITSNAHAWRGVAEPVELRLWPGTIGADYLIVRTGRAAERAAAEALSEALGGLPLAHEQAAAYCERLEMSFAEYRRRFDATPAQLLDADKDSPIEYHDGLTVAKTFALAIEKAAKLHPAAGPLMVHAAMLAPGPIPFFLFEEGRQHLGEPLAAELEGDGLLEAVAALRSFALLDREIIADERDVAVTTECIRLHRLVRQVAGAIPDGSKREAVGSALLKAVEAVYPRDVSRTPSSWPRARRLEPIATDLLDAEAPHKNLQQHEADLLARVASYRESALADYASARPLLERCLAIREQSLGAGHPDTIDALNNLALLLKSAGDLSQARPLYERVLALSEASGRGLDPATATIMNNFASLLQMTGEHQQARALYERALSIHEVMSGPDHPETATTLNNLAILIQNSGDPQGARPLCERALSIRETVRGSEHPETATSVHNLAHLLMELGDLTGAKPLFERALAMREHIYGPDHPETAMCLSNLGSLLRAAGEFSQARALCERAVVIYERSLGPDHLYTSISLHQLAFVLHMSGDLAAARPLYERSLSISEQLFGRDHPSTEETLNNLADVLTGLGDLEVARQLRVRVLALRERRHGPVHLNTAQSQHDLAVLLQATGDPNGARELFERCLSTCEQTLGSGHPHTATIRAMLARLRPVTGGFGGATITKPPARGASILRRLFGRDAN